MINTNTILFIIAIGIWLIWYELRYGIGKRNENKLSAYRLSKKWRDESEVKWNEFAEARKDAKSWEAYLKKQSTVNSEHKKDNNE